MNRKITRRYDALTDGLPNGNVFKLTFESSEQAQQWEEKNKGKYIRKATK